MDLSPLQHHDGVNAASALENLAHRLVAVHHRKAPERTCGRGDGDSANLPHLSDRDVGLDDPAAACRSGILDRLWRFFF